MKLNIFKITILISCVFLFTTTKVFGQQIAFSSTTNFIYDGNQNVPIEIQFSSSSASFTGNIYLTLPVGFDFSPAAGPGNYVSVPVSVPPAFTVISQTATVDINGRNQLKINFGFTNPNQNASFTGFFTVNSVKFPYGDLCGPHDYTFDLKLTDVDDNPILPLTSTVVSKIFTVNQRAATVTASHLAFSTGTCEDPYFHGFSVSAVNSPASVDITYTFNSLVFVVVGVFKVNEFSLFSLTPATYTESSGVITIVQPWTGTMSGSIPQNYRQYQIYLKRRDCSVLTEQPVTVSAKLSEDTPPACRPSSDFTKSTPIIDRGCCTDGLGATSLPFIENNYILRCVEECSMSFDVRITNMSGSAYDNMVYSLNFPNNSNLKIDNVSYNGTYTRTLSLADKQSLTFRVNFSLNPGTVAPFPVSVIANQTLVSSSSQPLDTKSYTLNFADPTACKPSVDINEYAKAPTAIFPVSRFQDYNLVSGVPQNNIDLYLVFNRSNPFAISNFSFEYRLNDYLRANSSVSYYYGPVSDPIGGGAIYSPVISNVAGAVINPEKTKITFNGINLPKGCPTDYLIIKLSVNSLSQLETGTKHNAIVLTPANGAKFDSFFLGRINWKATGTALVKQYVVPSCYSEDFENKEVVAFKQPVNKPFYYNYVLDNVGGTIINGSTMVGSLPHVNDKYISDQSISRNSAFSVTCPSEIKVYTQKDQNGVITTNLLTSGYELSFANSLADICPGTINSSVTCSSTTPGSICSGSPVFFKLKLNGALPAFTKLVLSMKVSIPAGTAPLETTLGMQGKATFAGTFTGSSLIEESGSGIVQVAKTTSCTSTCIECENSFAPIPGKNYVLSAWVKESGATAAVTYSNANISLFFKGITTAQDVTITGFIPTGEIIDGWQRIEKEFTVPLSAVKIKIKLNNAGSGDAFFDDIRIHPFDANMKSFVYDPKTLRLAAELDERNYATFYEYNEEGALIRVKKETAEGIMTIKESRNATQKEQ